MLRWGGEHQERFLLCCDFDIIAVGSFKIVDLGLSKDETSVLDCSLLESYSSGHVFDMLHYEVHRNTVVSEPRNNDICIYDRGQNEISEGILDKLVILLQYTDYWSSPFDCVSL